jgi:hypothetical protein
MEIEFIKQPNQPTGLIFANPDCIANRGVLIVQGTRAKSFAMSHNVVAIEEGRANGIIPQDLIIQVDSLAGATLGAQGAEALKDAMNRASRCTVVVVRRADRLVEYLRLCNTSALRSEEHDLSFLPPVVREILPEETEAEFEASMNMFEHDILTREIENSAFRESHEREENLGGDLAVATEGTDFQSLGGDLTVVTEGDDFQSVTSTVESSMPPNVGE